MASSGAFLILLLLLVYNQLPTSTGEKSIDLYVPAQQLQGKERGREGEREREREGEGTPRGKEMDQNRLRIVRRKQKLQCVSVS